MVTFAWAVVCAKAAVEVRPSATTPTMAMDNTVRTVFDHFIERTPWTAMLNKFDDIIALCFSN
jgi:hypothetical protein